MKNKTVMQPARLHEIENIWGVDEFGECVTLPSEVPALTAQQHIRELRAEITLLRDNINWLRRYK